ncbi:reverse transcriptase family protein [Oceanobacter sp. 3_MG-2023]|uniref:reverse transcriptase family protein n=1 Tax=Oceanobacter sp. 3_MG-2023 TaxID=3062622 RepID=UPI0027344192|nr:reverse transcriptase family protein [Oceanobacter sp. 3_MG-2023]MDP2506356.1 reverse transcriptase family protein [Oceanobacter sp. 3_MG-2023]
MRIEGPSKISTKSISNIRNLCEALDITEQELDKAIKSKKKYKVIKKPKINGSTRIVHKPTFLIRKIQNRINKRILANDSMIQWPSYLFGSIPKQKKSEKPIDHVSCAGVHCNAKSILKIDVKNFFDNIHFDVIYDIFHKFLKYPEEVSKTLTILCSHDNHLPQGALTSSFLANLALHDIEHKTIEKLSYKKLKYTRFVDDITISSDIKNYDFSFAKKAVLEMLYAKGLPINNEKTQECHSYSQAPLVHGLRVNFNEPRLPKYEIKKIRAAIHQLEIVAKEPNYRTTFQYRKDYNRVLGKTNKLSRVGHEKYHSFIQKISKIKPLPSPRDIVRCGHVIDRIERDYEKKKNNFWYKKRYYILHNRLNILAQLYPKSAASIRERMRKVKPEFEK